MKRFRVKFTTGMGTQSLDIQLPYWDENLAIQKIESHFGSNISSVCILGHEELKW